MATLPGLLDQVDELIETGMIGGPTLNAADYQIGTSVRALLAFEDLKPIVEPTPQPPTQDEYYPKYPSIASALPKQFLSLGPETWDLPSWTCTCDL